MRAGISAVLGLSALAVGGLAVLVTAQTPRPALELAPYANLHAMQQGRDLDLGFLPDEVHPGFGGEGLAVDIMFRDGDLHLNCPGGAYRIAASSGLLTRADLFCPTEKTNHADVVDQLRAAGFILTKDFKENPRRPEEWGRTVDAAFEALSNEDDGGTVTRIPLSRWERPNGLSVSLGAAFYAPAGHGRPMLEMDISAPVTCLFPLSVFTDATPGEDSWNSATVAPVRSAFDDTPWALLPPERRYALAAQVAQVLCAG